MLTNVTFPKWIHFLKCLKPWRENNQANIKFVTKNTGSPEEWWKDTDVALEVVAEASSHQLVGLLFLAQTVKG